MKKDLVLSASKRLRRVCRFHRNF